LALALTKRSERASAEISRLVSCRARLQTRSRTLCLVQVVQFVRLKPVSHLISGNPLRDRYPSLQDRAGSRTRRPRAGGRRDRDRDAGRPPSDRQGRHDQGAQARAIVRRRRDEPEINGGSRRRRGRHASCALRACASSSHICGRCLKVWLLRDTRSQWCPSMWASARKPSCFTSKSQSGWSKVSGSRRERHRAECRKACLGGRVADSCWGQAH
jgi:hypothetical protein